MSKNVVFVIADDNDFQHFSIKYPAFTSETDMPEDITLDLHRSLDILEDPIMEKPLARTQYYKVLLKALENDTSVELSVLNRILALCAVELQDDKKCCYLAMKIISLVLKNKKAGDIYPTLPNTKPSLIAVLNVIKTTALLSKMETLQTMCFETLLLYPNEILIEVVSNSTDMTEILNLYCHMQIPLEVRLLPCGVIQKLLKILPPGKKKDFVKENINVWFSKLIPTIFAGNSIDNEELNSKPLETLELLTDELVSIDYDNNPHWQTLFESIYNPQKYPSMMKLMLMNGWKNWHRLWIICIRLLKNQITRITSPVGSPINSMLPVVETAFKMDVTNRCRAFQCWDVLIDNFHTETNENYVVKRLKLLIIPLKSNNAKVEETALAKLKTWWHLIQRFQTRLDKFIDTVIISFLNYCFGKQKPGFAPGLLSVATKKRSVEIFIELAGHLCCQCSYSCVNVPKLNGRIVTKKVLIDYWNEWVHSLKIAISIFKQNVGITTNQITCLFKSLVAIVAELPDNNIRKDLFNELLDILVNPIKDDNHSEIAVPLIASLFNDQKIEVLLKPRDTQGPTYKIILFLVNESLKTVHSKHGAKYLSNILKPLAIYILDKEIEGSSKLLSWLLNLDEGTSKGNISFLLTALAECVYELEYVDVDRLTNLVLWPFSNSFVDVEYCLQVWGKLINYMYPKLKNNLKDDIATALWSLSMLNEKTLLRLHVCLAILKHELQKVSVVGYSKMVELLMLVTNEIKDESIINALNMLMETLVSLIQKVKDEKDQILVDQTMTVAENILKFLIPVLEKNNHNVDEAKIEDLLENIEPLLQIEPHYPKVVDALVNLSSPIKKYPVLQKRVTGTLKKVSTYFTQNNSTANSNLHKKIQFVISSTEYQTKTCTKPVNDNVNIDKFAEPDVKIIAKKGKKKETSIVNTVVENGEEFVVVKSNWKFNPRKLTENQKEKFQRKREDIPALYQDLSQSQDEFKLTTWKTDSQDSSSANSKSTSASKSAESGNVSEILKKMPSSDVVPKIIENIFSEKTETNANMDKITTTDVSKVKQTITKDPKSPRMALKDRVFRNVRNLIEKSNKKKSGKDLSESLIHVENIPKTPTSNEIINNIDCANSAPPKLNTERPSRVKRKPKKFDDVEIFSLKRGRRSSSLTDSQADSLSPTMTNEIEKDENVQREINQDNVIKKHDQMEDMTPDSSQDHNVIQTVAVIENIPSKAVPILESGKADISLIQEPIATASTDIVVSSKQNNKIEIDCTEILPKQTSIPGVLNVKDDKESDVFLLSDNMNVIVLSETKNDTKSPEKESTAADMATNNDARQNNNEPDAIVENNVTASENDKTNEGQSVSDDTKTDKTPKPIKKQDQSEPRSAKRSTVKKSRIEKELAIDTVEGHPFLKIQGEKRVTRKKLNSSTKNVLLNTTRRRTLTEKLNKSKADSKTTPNQLKKDKYKLNVNNESVTISESQDNCSEISDDIPLSEDVIESSQDSSFTAISVKPTKKSLKNLSVVVHKLPLVPSVGPFATQDLIDTDNMATNDVSSLDLNNKDDSILPQNKTAVTDKTDLELTENMDTQPIDNAEIESKDDSNDVILITDDDDDPVIVISSETQEIAEADTQPMNPTDLMETSPIKKKTDSDKVNDVESTNIETNNTMDVNTENDITTTMTESVIVSAKADEANTASSPFKDEAQRKKDFLDNTLEISPIKSMSPVRDKKSPSPETSSDYVVIKLSSPVQSNGEPFEKCNSPEIFTKDKVSPDKRDLSPPRDENASNNNSSPSSSLSLKKNRPQVRSGGRAAQMLGLCVPDRLQTIMNTERTETEEPKKSSPSSTPARRNLRILYNSVGENSENTDENEDSEIFLKFKRSLPTSDCSPSGPILKRKLVEITDDATVSPASKRKRVSFHDPPVSTTVSVQKYIEPCGIRSPQNSATKRQERQNLRSQVILKSPKRLDNVFKLDSALTKTVESFNDSEPTSSLVTQSMSLDETPAAEIIKHSDLNDVDPICPDLVNCNDPIENIAAELSSATMKSMFLKELEGQIATVGDLAKKTELEVNRLCIKAPKIKVAKRVLSDYASKTVVEVEPVVNTMEPLEEKNSPEIVNIEKIDVEMQTICAELNDVEIQTIEVPVAVGCVQTDDKVIAHMGAQTDESGVKSTKDLVISCIAERPDFVEKLGEHLEETSKQRIAECLPFDTLTDVFMKNITNSNTNPMITRILSKQSESFSSGEQQGQKDLALIQDYLTERFENRDLLLFCSQLLAKIHDKS